MLSLVGGELYQWDTGRIVKVVPDEDVTVHEVHFSTKRMDYAYVLKTYTEDGVTYCAIPNIILQQSSRLLCYEVCENSDGEETIAEATFNITKRNRPEDYVYTEQEHFTVVSLENRLAKVEESAHVHKNKDALDSITEEDLRTWRSPVTNVVQYTEQTLTDGQKAQARNNIGAIDESSLEPYAKKTEIPTVPTTDSELSTTSTNPVQNKIVKAELDKKLESIPVDGTTIKLNDQGQLTLALTNANGVSF